MALPDKIMSYAQPLLEPGETIVAAFPAIVSPFHPILATCFPPLSTRIAQRMGGFRYYAIVRTDRSLVFFNTTTLQVWRPSSIAKRLPADTDLGPLKGIFAPTEIDGEKIWVNKSFHQQTALV